MIDRQWVLTAGHCTQYCVGYPECSREISQSEITYKVIMGEYDQSYDEVRFEFMGRNLLKLHM